MGKSPGKWLKSLLSGKKTSKSSSTEEKPATFWKKSQEKRRWSFGKSSTQNRGYETLSYSPSLPTNAREYFSPVIAQEEQIKHGEIVPESPKVSKDYSAVEDAPVTIILDDRVPREITAHGNSWSKNEEEKAAILIQTAFRGYLARRALKALKGLVRLQALVRGHIVRRQAGTTLRCVQALVRVQARVRARRVRMSEEGQAVQQKIQQSRQLDLRSRRSLESWNSSTGTVQELEAKNQSRQEAVAKRERALAYAFSRQLWRSAQKKNSLVFDGEHDQSNWGWSWLERWMAARPWETAFLDDAEENSMEAVNREEAHSGAADGEPKTFPFGKTQQAEITLLEPIIPSSIDTDPLSLECYPPKLVPTSTLQLGGHSSDQTDHMHASAVPSMSVPTVISLAPSKHTKSSSSRGSATQNGVGPHDEAMVVAPSGAMSNGGGRVLPDVLSTDPISKATNRAGFKSSLNRRSFSGPLKGLHENAMTGSPIVPSYMAATQSAKAKARSQSNPKLRPTESDDKASPNTKRRTSLPAEVKQNSVPWRSFRSSSAKGFPYIRASREGGG